MFVWWGDSLINLYNDAYKSIVGGKHPEARGLPASVVWREIWHQVAPRAESALRDNEGTYDESLLLIMERYGYQEETYYTFSYSPVPNDRGGTGGILCANSDDTQRIIGGRQLALLRELAAGAAEARSGEEACARSAACLATNPKDLPFALLYLVDPGGKVARLAGAAGVEPGHAAAPEVMSLEGGSPWPLGEALAGQATRLVEGPAELFRALSSGAWPRPPRHVALAPVVTSGRSGRAGVLVAGLSPFRQFDDEYRGFLGLVAGQIAAGMANAYAYEAERRRAQELAELDRAKMAFFSNVSHEFHVWERFRQADGSSTRAHGGLGLGLAIVRHVVELHDGAVRAESAGLGRGASFAVRLPSRASRGLGAEGAPGGGPPDGQPGARLHLLASRAARRLASLSGLTTWSSKPASRARARSSG